MTFKNISCNDLVACMKTIFRSRLVRMYKAAKLRRADNYVSFAGQFGNLW